MAAVQVMGIGDDHNGYLVNRNFVSLPSGERVYDYSFDGEVLQPVNVEKLEYRLVSTGVIVVVPAP